MSRNKTSRLSLVTIAILAVLLCLVATASLSFSPTVANAAAEIGFLNDYEASVTVDGNEWTEEEVSFDYDPAKTIASHVAVTALKNAEDVTVVAGYKGHTDSGTEYSEIQTGTLPKDAGTYQVYYFDAEVEDEMSERLICVLTVTIAPAKIMMMPTMSGTTFYYRNAVIPFGYTSEDARFGCEIVWEKNGQLADPKDVGTYTGNITLTNADPENNPSLDLTNYIAEPSEAILTIEKRQLSVAFDSSVPYNGEKQISYTLSMVPETSEDAAEVATYALPELTEAKSAYPNPGNYSVSVTIPQNLESCYYFEYDNVYDVYTYQVDSMLEITTARVPDSVIAFGGTLGETYMTGEENKYTSLGIGSIVDRVENTLADLPGYHVSDGEDELSVAADTWQWAAGSFNADNEGEASWYTQSTDSFPANLAEIGQTYTLRVQINGNSWYDTGYVYMPFTVQKIRVFMRAEANLTYNGTNQTPTVTFYQYYCDGSNALLNTMVENATVAQTNVGTYELSGNFLGDYGDSYYFVEGDEEAVYSIVPATLTPGVSMTNVDGEHKIVYGTTPEYATEGVEDQDMLGEDDKDEQGIVEIVEYRYRTTADQEWSEWAVVGDAATKLKNVGLYELRYNFTCSGVEVAGDHCVNYVSAGDSFADFEIVPREVTLTWKLGETSVEAHAFLDALNAYEGEGYYTFESTVYNGALQAPALTLGNIVNNDDVRANTTDPWVLGSAILGGVNVGKFGIGIGEFLGDDVENYTLPEMQYRSVYYAITPAALTITANDKTITYGDEAANAGVSYDGFVGEEDESVLGGELAYAYTYHKNDDVGDYVVTPSGLTGSNYDITFLTGKLTVEAADLTVTTMAQDGTLTYNGSAQTPAVTTDVTAVNDQTITYTYSKTEDGEYVALAEITYTNVADGGTLYYKLTAPNHNVSAGSFAVTMEKAAATWTAPSGNSLTYNGTAQELVVAPTNVVGGVVKYSVDGNTWGEEIPTGVDAGNYEVTIKVEPDDNHTAYGLSALCTPSISALEVEIEWTEYTYTYDGEAHLPTATITNIVNNDEVAVSLSVDNRVNAGNYTISANDITLTGARAANYTVKDSEGITLVIQKLEVEIEWTDDTYTYDGEAHLPTATITNIVNDDEVAVSYNTGVCVDAGNFEFYVGRIGLTGEQASNYKLKDSEAITLRIQQREVTVAFEHLTDLVYNGQEQAPTIVLGNVVAADEGKVTGVFASNYGARVDASHNSTYTVMVGSLAGEKASNYKLPTSEEAKQGSFVLQKKEVTVVWSNTELTYNGESQKPTATVDPACLVEGDEDLELTITVAGAQIYANANTVYPTYGAQAQLLSGSDNYKLPDDPPTHTYVIEQAEVGLDWESPLALEFVYDGYAHKPIVYATGIFGQDICNVTVTGEQTKAGTHTATVTALENLNYKLPASGLTHEFVINKKEVQVSFSGNGWVYDGQPHLPSIILYGVLSGDKVEGVYSAESVAQTNVGENYPAIVASLSGEDAENYTLPADEANRSETFLIAQRSIKIVGVIGKPEEVTYGDEEALAIAASKLEGVVDYAKVADDSSNEAVDDLDDIILLTVGLWQNTPVDSLADVHNVGKYYLIGACINENYNVYFDFNSLVDYLEIVKKEIIVTPDAGQCKVYGEDDSALTYTLSETVDGETLVLEGALEREAGEEYGEYDITFGTLALTQDAVNANYSLAFTAGVIFRITKNSLTVEVEQPDVVYGTDYAGPSLGKGISVTGWAGNDSIALLDEQNVSVNYVLAGDADSLEELMSYPDFNDNYVLKEKPVVVGDYYVVATISGLDNYEDAEYGYAKYSVSGAELTVTVENKVVAYGDAAPIYTATYSGFVAGETEQVLGGTLAFACDYAQGSAAGTYAIKASGITADNYLITYIDGELTVGKIDIRFVADKDASVGFGYAAGDSIVAMVRKDGEFVEVPEEELPGGVKITDLVTKSYAQNGQTVFAPINAGEYEIVLTESDSVVARNFNISVVNGELTVNKMTIVVKADDKTSVYGESIVALTAKVYESDEEEVLTDLPYEGSISDLFTIEKEAGTDAGTYAISIVPSNNAIAANYDIRTEAGVYVIEKKVVSVALYVDGNRSAENDVAIVYDGQEHTFELRVEGMVGEDSLVMSADAGANVFSVEIAEVIGQAIAAKDATVENYYLQASEEGFSYAITPKAIEEVKFLLDGEERNSVVYDGANHVVIAQATALDGTPFTLGSQAKIDAGAYTVSVLAGDYNDGNYELTEDATFRWTITESAPVVDEETGNKTYGKEIDAETAAEGVDVTVLFETAASDATEGKEVKATVGTSEIVFDKSAIAAIAASDADVTFTFVVTNVENAADVTDEHLKGAVMIIEASLGGVTFAEGNATISVDFDKTAPKDTVAKVYYVDEQGNRTDMNATFANGKVTFVTKHFSDYIVVFESVGGGLSGGAIAGIVIGCVVGAAGIAVGVFFLLKKKKAKQA